MSNNSGSDNNKTKLIGKYVFPKYGYGDNHLNGCWALTTGPSSARVHMPRGRVEEYFEGQEITFKNGGSGIVQILEDRIMVGDYTMPLFHFDGPAPENLEYSELRARPTRPGSHIFYLEKENNANLPADERFLLRIKVGDEVDSLKSQINYTKNGQLYAGNHLIAVHPLEYEVKLAVYSDYLNGGHRAYFNLCEPGSDLNMRDGIAGSFFPKKGRTPANFAEMNPEDGKLYKTCTLFGNDNTKDHITGIYKTLQVAVRERELYKAIKDMESTMPSELGPLESIEGADVESLDKIRMANPDKSEEEVKSLYLSQHPMFETYSKLKKEHKGYTVDMKKAHVGKFFIAPAPRGGEAEYKGHEMVAGQSRNYEPQGKKKWTANSPSNV